jgi:hypothetical protein
MFGFNRSRSSKKSVVTSTRAKTNAVNQPTKVFKASVNFERYHITYEGTVKKNAKVSLFWPFAGDITANDIIDVRAGCKCTAQFSWDDTGVRAEFTNMEKDAELKLAPHQISKTLRVFFNDGIGRIPNGRNGMSWAPEKFSEVLQFTGMVSR